MNLGLEGKVAIITGGSKGIGRATALRMLEEGASTFVCARGQEALDEVASAGRRIENGRIVTAQADLMRPEDIKSVVARCIAEFGKIDILVNNAGSARPGHISEVTDEWWLDDWNLKFFGYVRMVRETIPHMKDRASGVIINVIGMGGLMPTAGYLTGGSANAALNHFTKAIADEGAPHGIRSVGINPGPVDTERYRIFAMPKNAASKEQAEQLYRQALAASTPFGRPARAEEVADLIAFMASERAAFISGTNISIDGGKNHAGLFN